MQGMYGRSPANMVAASVDKHAEKENKNHDVTRAKIRKPFHAMSVAYLRLSMVWRDFRAFNREITLL